MIQKILKTFLSLKWQFLKGMPTTLTSLWRGKVNHKEDSRGQPSSLPLYGENMFGAFTGNLKDHFLNSRNLAQGISVESPPPFFPPNKESNTCPAKVVKKKKKTTLETMRQSSWTKRRHAGPEEGQVPLRPVLQTPAVKWQPLTFPKPKLWMLWAEMTLVLRGRLEGPLGLLEIFKRGNK